MIQLYLYASTTILISLYTILNYRNLKNFEQPKSYFGSWYSNFVHRFHYQLAVAQIGLHILLFVAHLWKPCADFILGLLSYSAYMSDYENVILLCNECIKVVVFVVGLSVTLQVNGILKNSKMFIGVTLQYLLCDFVCLMAWIQILLFRKKIGNDNFHLYWKGTLSP